MTERTSTQSDHQPWVMDSELVGLFATLETDEQPPSSSPLLPVVTARIARRRRHRRATTAVVAATTVLIAGGVVAHVYGPEPDHDQASATDNPGLTISYSNQSYTFTSFSHVACTTDDAGHEVLQAVFYPEGALRGSTLLAPVLSFEARPDLVASRGPDFDLPESAGDSENNAFTLFTAVPLSSGEDNEASSQEEAATGTVTITNLSCGPDPTFALTANATLDSEVSGPKIPINGQISYPPSPQDPH